MLFVQSFQLTRPKSLKFVAAEGATESKHDGGQVQFQPVEQLDVGKQVT